MMKIRGVQLHRNDVKHMKKAVRICNEYDFNQIQLSHDIIMYAQQVIDSQKLAEEIEHISTLAHTSGIRVFVWDHLVSYPPDRIIDQEGRLYFDRPGFWKWQESVYRKFFECIPSVDGVVLSFGDSSHIHIYDNSQTNSVRDKTDRMLSSVEFINGLCKEHGKELYVRDWAGGIATRDALTQSPREVSAMTKSDAGDWRPDDPHNPNVGFYQNRKQMVELDLNGEYLGRSWLPWCCPEYIKYRLSYCHERGISEAVGRIDTFDLGRTLYSLPYGVPSDVGSTTAIGTTNEINIYAYSVLTQDINSDVEQIWKDWTHKRYGKEAAEYAEQALKPTSRMMQQLYWSNAYIGLAKILPSLAYLESVTSEVGIIGHKIDEYRVKSHIEEAIEKEYGEVERLCTDSVAQLESGKKYFKVHDYEDLIGSFQKVMTFVRMWKLIFSTFIYYELFRTYGSPKWNQYLTVNQQSLVDLAKEVETRFGAEHWPSNPVRIRNFVWEIRNITNYYQKQAWRIMGEGLQDISLYIVK